MHNPEKFIGLFDENAVVKINGNMETFRGKKEVQDYFKRWNKAFPDVKMKIRSKIATDDSVIAEYEFTGTNEGRLNLGKDLPEIAPTHKKVSTYGCYITKVKNGRISETNFYTDSLGLVEQLGVEGELMHHAN